MLAAEDELLAASCRLPVVALLPLVLRSSRTKNTVKSVTARTECIHGSAATSAADSVVTLRSLIAFLKCVCHVALLLKGGSVRSVPYACVYYSKSCPFRIRAAVQERDRQPCIRLHALPPCNICNAWQRLTMLPNLRHHLPL